MCGDVDYFLFIINLSCVMADACRQIVSLDDRDQSAGIRASLPAIAEEWLCLAGLNTFNVFYCNIHILINLVIPKSNQKSLEDSELLPIFAVD